jgi:hypothetical protein
VTDPFAALNDRPRVELMTLPTPLEHAPSLSRELSVEVWLKRDDVGSLGLAGNKVRKLEYTLGEALSHGAETVVTLGAPQSNHARTMASAAARLGLHAVLVMGGEPPAGPPTGNLLLDALFGAEVIYAGTEDWAELAATVEAVRQEPSVVPKDRSQERFTQWVLARAEDGVFSYGHFFPGVAVETRRGGRSFEAVLSTGESDNCAKEQLAELVTVSLKRLARGLIVRMGVIVFVGRDGKSDPRLVTVTVLGAEGRTVHMGRISEAADGLPMISGWHLTEGATEVTVPAIQGVLAG